MPTAAESVEVLMSTMHRTSASFAVATHLEGPCLIINQGDDDGVSKTTVDGNPVRMLSVRERGLSRSRNLALANARGDICILADDDVVFESGYVDTVRRAYSDNPQADIIAFQVPRVGDPSRVKNYRSSPARLGRRGVLKVSSVEISFRRESVLRARLTFDLQFGAGTAHLMGEDTIFLLDALREGLSVLYVPWVIATTDVSNSTWFSAMDERYFAARGAVLRRISPRGWPFLALAFAARKIALYRHHLSATQALKLMVRGARELRA